MDSEAQPLLGSDDGSNRRRRLAMIALATAGAVIGIGVLGSALVPRLGSNPKRIGIPQPLLVQGSNGAVSSENPLCSDVGVDILRSNGSAMDAAIATALCIGVTNSYSSGIGGGGFLIARGVDGSYDVVDFREEAPATAHVDMYADDPRKAQFGGLAVGVPGEIRGFEVAHKLHGRLPWAKLFEAAIRISRHGWAVTPALFKVINSLILTDPEFGGVFAPNGALLQVGEIVKRPKLAATLEVIATDGASAFYEGDIAESLVRTTQKTGGILTLDDMRNYKVLKPLVGSYHDRRVFTCPLPAGGAVLLSILNILEGYDLKGSDKGLSIHRITEALKHGFSQRTEYGDPNDPVYTNISSIALRNLDKRVAELIRSKISSDRTYPIEHYAPEYDVKEDHGTMHISVLSADGTAVSLTSTVNLGFGNNVMDPDTGIILNDEMDDFSIPGVANGFGLPPSPYNYVRPQKRPLSSAVPVIVETADGTPELVAGGAGGSLILSATLQVLLNVLEFGMDIAGAVGQPRLHHQLVPNWVTVENPYDQALITELYRRGHEVFKLAEGVTFTGVEAVRRRADGIIEAASDARKGGVSAGW